MDYKKLLIATIATLTVISTAQESLAQEIQAQVQKNTANSLIPIDAPVLTEYQKIEEQIEYGDYKTAEKNLNKLIATNPNDIEALALRSVLLAKQYKLDPAQKEIDELLAKDPKNADVHYAQGLIYMKRQTSSDAKYLNDTENLLKSAIKEFVNAINIDSSNYQSYNAMGVATLKLGNVNDAKNLFNIALKYNPNYATAYDNLGSIDLVNGDYKSARSNFLKSIELNSHNPTAWYHMAQVEAASGEYSKALKYINDSLHVNPNSSPNLNLQGEIYLKQNNQAAAINSFKKAMNVKPEHSSSYLNLANIYADRSDREFAIAQLKTAASINANDMESIAKIAKLSYNTKNYEQAVDYYSKLLSSDKYKDDAILGLADTYFEMSKENLKGASALSNKELLMAFDYINNAIEQNPEDLKLYLARLKIAKLTNESTISKDAFNTIMQKSSDNLVDNLIKAEAFLTLENEAEATFAFENVLNFSNSIQDDLYVGEILVYHKKLDTAKLAFEKVLMKDPSNREAGNGLAYIKVCEKKADKFIEIAKLQYAEKNYTSAIEACNQATEFFTTTSEIALLKAQASEDGGYYSEALNSYSEYLALTPNAENSEEITKKISKLEKKAGTETQNAGFWQKFLNFFGGN
ncbi:MAG: tetratricopeptide repeat protein [Candidatus Gastranaerophilales bacterium]